MIPPGLCGSCTHAQEIASSRGSVFVRCNLSFTDPRFPRYPALPVLQCDGYTRVPSTQAGSDRAPVFKFDTHT